jgi:hypothetical protein
MRTRILLPGLLAIPLIGCTGFGPWLAAPSQSMPTQTMAGANGDYGSEDGPNLFGNSPNACESNTMGAPGCLPPLGQPCPPKPCAPKPPKVIRVKVPPQKVVVEAPQKQEQPKQGAFNPPQEVILVPRTVFMPFVAQTPTGPARVLSLQGAVPLVSPPAEQPAPQGAAPPPQGAAPPPQGAAPEQPKEGAGPKKEAPPPCKVEVPVPCMPDMDLINRRLDRLECILQQLCGPPCPPAHRIP